MHMKPFFWKHYDGRRIILCGPLIRCLPILMEFPKGFDGEILICDDDHTGDAFEDVTKDLPIPRLKELACGFISCKDLYDYRNDIVILAGRTFFDRYRENLGARGLSDFYSAVPILKSGPVKESYFAYFSTLYRRQQNGLYLGGIELNLTKRCSLKCRDCANLLQYYDRPERLDKDVVIRSLRNLLKALDGLAMLKLMGGEPLLEQDMLKEILKLPELTDGSKVLGIQIISNGTILFRKDLLEVMQENPYASVLLSNYKELSSKEEEIRRQLSEYQIPFAEIGDDDRWMDYGDPRCAVHNEAEALQLFSKCRSKENCCTILDGRLYHCPRAAHGAQLGFYSDDDESTDLLDTEQLRERVSTFYHRKAPVEACTYCNNMCGKLIPRAIQQGGIQRGGIQRGGTGGRG